MSDQVAKQKPLDLVVDRGTFNLIIRKVTETRKDVGDGRTYTYSEVTHGMGDKEIKVLGRHFSLDIVLGNRNNSCKNCYRKGYQFANIPKSKYPNPNPFLIDSDTLPKDLSDEEQQRWVKEQEKVSTWRVMNICRCAIKRTKAKHPEVLTNELNNIWMTLDYEIVDKVEKVEEIV